MLRVERQAHDTKRFLRHEGSENRKDSVKIAYYSLRRPGRPPVVLPGCGGPTHGEKSVAVARARPDLRAGADTRVQGRHYGIPPGVKGEAVVTRLLRGIGSRIDLESIAPRPSVDATGHPSQPTCPRGAWRRIPFADAARHRARHGGARRARRPVPDTGAPPFRDPALHGTFVNDAPSRARHVGFG